MVNKYISKPVEVEAFIYGSNAAAPLWFLTAIRKRQIQIMPTKGMVVVKTDAGKINFYDPITFNALFIPFESEEEEVKEAASKKKCKPKPKKK